MKLKKMGFTMECLIFSQFPSTNVKISPSNLSISGIFLKFSNFLGLLVLNRSTSREATHTSTFC